MNKNKMKALLDATNGGLDIFRTYIKTPFTVDKTEVVKSLQKRFTVYYSERYKNYVITIEDWNGMKWSNTQNFNAIWYVKESLGLSELQTYEHIEYNMDLNIPINSNVEAKEESAELEVSTTASKVKEDPETTLNKPSLLEELMNSRTKRNEDDDTSSETEFSNKLFRDSL